MHAATHAQMPARRCMLVDACGNALYAGDLHQQENGEISRDMRQVEIATPANRSTNRRHRCAPQCIPRSGEMPVFCYSFVPISQGGQRLPVGE